MEIIIFIAIFISTSFLVNGYSPDIVELHNTENTRWNGWIKNSGKYDGWRSQNIPPSGQLVYGLCAMQGGSRDNWLRSPYIKREQALSIKIEILFTMRSCKSRPEQRMNCEDTLHLMVYEADSQGDLPNSWSDRIYTTVAVVSPDIKWTDSRQNDNIINTKTYSIEPRRAGFFVALRDIGSCAMVKRVRVFYVSCATVMRLFSKYPRTVVSHEYRIREAKGQCVSGAELVDTQKEPILLCQPNGQWHFSDLTFCQCKSGFTPSDNKMDCIKCQHNTFKPLPGSDKCIYCPKYSSSDTGAKQCTCNNGLFAILSYKNKWICAEPPSGPLNAKAKVTVNGQIHLTWDMPINSMNVEDALALSYKILCLSCNESRERLYFTPGVIVNQSSVYIDALQSGITYNFSITPLNSLNNFITSPSPSSRTAFISITTSSADQSLRIQDLVVRNIQSRQSFLISWSAPPDASVTYYQIVIHSLTFNSYHIKPIILDTILKTTEKVQYEFPFESKKQVLTYRIKIRARSMNAWGAFSPEKQISLNDVAINVENNKKEEKGELWIPNRLLIISIFGFGLILMVILIPVCFYCRYISSRSMRIRKKQHISKPLSTTLDMANYSQIYNGSNITRVYIDPSNYEDPSTIVQEFAHEIDPGKINIECVIGEGEFGEVCKGRLLQNDGSPRISVAIKTLKAGCSEKERMNFLMEAAIMGQFSHPNIIKLEGVVTKTQPIMILTQFIEFGSLEVFLKKKRNQFSTLQLLGMLRGIVSGMRYLSDMRYVHRDLAARNILVDKDLCCKVSDFGLSREIGADTTEGAYTTKGGLIPVRWTAPEAINYRRFTSSSDVWSFGVVMWEVMSYGERPYWNWSNKDVLQSIESGYRLPAPKGCPPAIHLLMLDCWTYERADRPKFTQIIQSIDALLRCPEALSTLPLSLSMGRLSSIDSNRSLNPLIKDKHYNNKQPLLQSEPVFSPESTISQWLDCLDLPFYKDNFFKNNLIYLGQICKFKIKDLTSIDISEPDHIHKIMSNIEAMQNYFETLKTPQFALL